MGLAHVPVAVAMLACSDTVHTIVWREGRLEIPDHSDPEAERALAALGADPCRCVEIYDAWQRCAADPRALVLGPRGPQVAPPDPGSSAGGVRRAARGRPGGAIRRPAMSGPAFTMGSRRPSVATTAGLSESDLDPLEQILELGGGISHRLVVTAAAALQARVSEPALRARLQAALYGRVLTALSRWLGEVPTLELEMIAADAPPSLVREADGTAFRASLPFTWLLDVWAPGLETLAGRFGLSATPTGTGGWDLLTVDPSMTVSAGTLVL